MTSTLIQRVWQHKEGVVDGFTKKYSCKLLVYYEMHEDMATAIAYEKKLKNRGRQWKIELMEHMNPTWNDLYESITQ